MLSLLQKYHLPSVPLHEEVEKRLRMDPASEDSAADSGLKEASLLKQHILLARCITPEASPD